MIEPNEIRIGNWYLSTKFQTPIKCDLSDLAQIYHNIYGAEVTKGDIAQVFQPIPLNEEWLLKMGFEKDGNEFNIKGELYYIKKQTAIFEFGVIYPTDWNHYVDLKNIKHVHQLQNLYFELTGKELTIK